MPPDAAPDLALILPRLLGRPLPPGERLAVALSGGPDSCALLTLAVAAFPGRVTALTVDHALRPGSAAEAADVAAQCGVRGIPHALLTRTGPAPVADVQAQARRARYRLLADWCRAHDHAVLMTAHHADDQAETLLMRLNRGSGLAGLAGIRPVRRLAEGVMLVRPLLTVRRSALGSFAAAAGWRVVDDPSNRDPRHDRSRVRVRLSESPWLDVPALAAAAGHLAAAEAALDWTVDQAWRGRVSAVPDGLALDMAGLPAELVRRLLAKALERLAPEARVRGGDIARLAAAAATGHIATLAGFRLSPGPVWHLHRAPTRRGEARAGQIRTG